jgi:hypothetical protein
VTKDRNKNLKPWKPGTSGNPGGLSKIDAALKVNRNLTKKVIKKVGDALMLGDMSELEYLKENGVPLERWLSNVIIDGIEKSDMKTLDTLLPWLVGKLKDEIDVSLPKPTIITYKGQSILLGSKLENEGDE